MNDPQLCKKYFNDYSFSTNYTVEMAHMDLPYVAMTVKEPSEVYFMTDISLGLLFPSRFFYYQYCLAGKKLFCISRTDKF